MIGFSALLHVKDAGPSFAREPWLHAVACLDSGAVRNPPIGRGGMKLNPDRPGT